MLGTCRLSRTEASSSLQGGTPDPLSRDYPFPLLPVPDGPVCMDFPILPLPYTWSMGSVVFWVWLPSLSIMFSSSVHTAARISPSFFFMVEKYFPAELDPVLFICSWVDGRLGCFHLLAAVNSAPVNVGAQGLVWVPVFGGLGSQT